MANLKNSLESLDAQVLAGDILGAFETFFANDCTTFSSESDRTRSKSEKRDALKWFFSGVARINKIELKSQKISGDQSDSEFIFDFTGVQEQPLYWHEIVRRVWKNGHVVSEQYLQVEAAKPEAPKKAAAKSEKSEAPKAAAAPAKPAAKTAAKADDLKKIEGIGPKIAELLIAAGIETFAKLAKTKAAKLQEILTAAGSRFQMHDATTWPAQAELAAAGNWDELAKWQKELNKGKA